MLQWRGGGYQRRRARMFNRPAASNQQGADEARAGVRKPPMDEPAGNERDVTGGRCTGSTARRRRWLSRRSWQEEVPTDEKEHGYAPPRRVLGVAGAQRGGQAVA